MLREGAQGQTEKEIREVLQATKISDSDAVTLATVKKRRRAAALQDAGAKATALARA